MIPASDRLLWAEVEDRARIHGWDARERVCREAASHACRRLKARTDAEREEIRGRIDRLWVERVTMWGPV